MQGQLISAQSVWQWLLETMLEAVKSSMAYVVLGEAERGEEGYYQSGVSKEMQWNLIRISLFFLLSRALVVVSVWDRSWR